MEKKFKSVESIYKEALSLKDSGNELFRSKLYAKAKRKYHYALIQIRAISSRDTVGRSMSFLSESIDHALQYNKGSGFKEKVESLEADCYRNMALAFMKENNWEKGLEYSEKALEFDENDEKSLYRYATCAWSLKMPGQGEKASKKLVNINPESKVYQQIHEKILKQLKTEVQYEKKLCQKMFQTQVMTCNVGFPDLIAFLTLFSIGLIGVVVPTLQYVSIGTEQFGADNISIIIDCYNIKSKDSNETCHTISAIIQDQLAKLSMKCNIVQGVLAPVFVFALGGISDIIGKRCGVMFILLLGILRCIGITLNALAMDRFPSNIYILLSGVLLGLAGGSQMAICHFLVGYLSVTTPSSKQTIRFSLLIGIGLLGFILGPLVAGLILQFTTAYYIVGFIAIALLVAALIISLFGMKRVKSSEAEQRFSNISGIGKKFTSAIRFQYENTVDMFKYQSHLSKFIGANVMYMLTSVGLASPLVIVSTVYVIGEPFKWTPKARGYFMAALGFVLAAQTIVTVRILKMFSLSRPAIIRLGIFLGFVGTFFLAFATSNSMLILGCALMSFVIIANPTTQSIILSLVEVEQTGAAVGVMAAMNAFAESCLVNLILFVYQRTKNMMNGFCFLTLSFLLGIDLVIAMFYQHPQTTREDRSILSHSDDNIAGSPPYPSSDVLKGGVPKNSTRTSKEYSRYDAPDERYAATGGGGTGGGGTGGGETREDHCPDKSETVGEVQIAPDTTDIIDH